VNGVDATAPQRFSEVERRIFIEQEAYRQDPGAFPSPCRTADVMLPVGGCGDIAGVERGIHGKDLVDRHVTVEEFGDRSSGNAGAIDDWCPASDVRIDEHSRCRVKLGDIAGSRLTE